MPFPRRVIPPESVDDLLLLLRVSKLPLFCIRLFYRVAVDLFCLHTEHSLFLQRADNRSSDVELLCHKLVFQLPVIQKCGQKARPRLLVLFQIIMELTLSGLFIKQKPQPLLHLRVLLLPDREHGFQRLDHRPAVILFHPRGKGDELRLDLHPPL